jgi:predicted DNA-binding protein (MmcQ/YjbR family)
MVTSTEVVKWAKELDDVVQQPHFEKASFRVRKKIFATLDIDKNLMVIKLNEVDQSVFSSHDPQVIYPVPNKWGKQGWTCVDLKKVKKSICRDALQTAYETVSKK